MARKPYAQADDPSSAELQAHIEANPHNLPNVAGFPPLSPRLYWAARYEEEGRAAYLLRGSRPYTAGTMAAARWEAGYKQAFLACNPHMAWADGAAMPYDKRPAYATSWPMGMGA